MSDRDEVVQKLIDMMGAGDKGFRERLTQLDLDKLGRLKKLLEPAPCPMCGGVHGPGAA